MPAAEPYGVGSRLLLLLLHPPAPRSLQNSSTAEAWRLTTLCLLSLLLTRRYEEMHDGRHAALSGRGDEKGETWHKRVWGWVGVAG